MANCEEELRLAKERIKELEENEIAFHLRLWLGLEEILDKDKGFYYPPELELNVFDCDFEVNGKISINPKDLICIITEKSADTKGNTRRKKLLFVKNNSLDSNISVRTFSLNNNEYNFEKLFSEIDPLTNYLILVSKSIFANVKFYDIAGNNQLSINLKDIRPNEIEILSFPSSKTRGQTIENFNKLKTAYESRILLQKKVLGYKYSIGVDD